MELTPDVGVEEPSDSTPLAFRAVRGGLWVALSSYFNFGFGFLANLALTRILAPEHFGVFALAFFFFSLLNLRPKIGVGYAFGQRRETTGELLGTHLGLELGAGLLTLLVAAGAVPVLRILGYSWDVSWAVLVLAVAGVSDSLLGTAWVLLDKELHFGRTSLVSSLVFPLSYLPAFWLALHGGGYWSLLAQNASYAMLLLAAMWWVARRQLPHVWRLRWRFDRRVAVDLVRFGGPTGLASLAWMLSGQFDNFLVGTFVGMAALGFYDRAYRIAQWPSMLVTGVLVRAAFYTYARLQDDPVRLKKTVTMSLWLITTLALPLAIAIFAAAPDLVRLLYGERWLPTAPILRFLIAYSVMRPLSDDANSLFIAVGQPHLTLIVAVVQATTLALIGTPLTLRYGVLGTCVAVAVMFAVTLSLTYYYVSARVVAIDLWDSLGLPALATVLALAAYAGLARSLGLSGWPLLGRVVAVASFTAGTYVATVLLLQPRTTLERVAYVRRLLLGKP